MVKYKKRGGISDETKKINCNFIGISDNLYSDYKYCSTTNIDGGAWR